MSNQRRFLLGYSIFFSAGLIGLLFIEQGDAVLFFAERRTPFLNACFRVFNWWGEGLTVVLLTVLYLFIHYGKALTLFCLGLLELGSSSLLKRVIFGNQPRPLAYFKEVDPAWLIEGVEHHSNYSFPSGHTLTAFGLSFFLVLANRQRWIVWPLLLLAIFGGVARIYLFQHFLQDVVAGSLVGISLAWCAWAIANHPKAWMGRSWAQGALGKKSR